MHTREVVQRVTAVQRLATHTLSSRQSALELQSTQRIVVRLHTRFAAEQSRSERHSIGVTSAGTSLTGVSATGASATGASLTGTSPPSTGGGISFAGPSVGETESAVSDVGESKAAASTGGPNPPIAEGAHAEAIETQASRIEGRLWGRIVVSKLPGNHAAGA